MLGSVVPGKSGDVRHVGGNPVDFEDWIRAQLASSPPAYAAPLAVGRLRIHAPRIRRGHLLQAFTAGAAVTFFALGLMAGAPLPAMQILPSQKSQSLPVTSLAVAPVAAPAAGAPAAAATTPATAKITRRHAQRRADLTPRTFSRQDAATPWASSSTGQPRTGATTLRQSRLAH
jgi:hypothetical protein